LPTYCCSFLRSKQKVDLHYNLDRPASGWLSESIDQGHKMDYRLLKGLMLISMAAAIAGCALEPSQRAQRVLPAYPEMVSDCAFIGGVTGNAPALALPIGEQYAKYQALDEAAALGATHIVWADTSGGLFPGFIPGFQPVAQGRAYYCDPDRALPNSYRYIDQYLRLHRYPYDGDRD